MTDETFKLDEYLKKEYGYDFINYKELSKQDFVEFEGIGANSLFWIPINGEKYLLKKIEEGPGEYTWLGELLSQKIAKILGIPAAEYRVCRLKDNIAILSKKFTLDNETIILGAQIIQEVLNRYPYLKEKDSMVLEDEEFIELYNVPKDIVEMNNDYRLAYLHNNLNNIEELWSIIEIYLNIHELNPESLQPIMEYLTMVFMFDVFTMQGDRHMGNWAIIQAKDGNRINIKTSKLFDNSASFNLWRYKDIRSKFYNILESFQKHADNEKTKESFINFLYTHKLLLTPSEDAIKNAKKKKREPNTNVLDYFLKVSDSSYIEIFKNYLQLLRNTNILEVLNEIEQEQHIIIPEDVKEYVCDVTKYNLLLIDECLKRYIKESGRGLSE